MGSERFKSDTRHDDPNTDGCIYACDAHDGVDESKGLGSTIILYYIVTEYGYNSWWGCRRAGTLRWRL